MNVLNDIILIHPTKCAGTTISQQLFRLKGLSENTSAFYSGHYFNAFFQKNIQFFYFIFHSRNFIRYFFYLSFYLICFYFKLRNLFSNIKYGLTFASGSIQHFTYKQWHKIKEINANSICISVVAHPQNRIVSSFYFLGYDKHYTFLEFLQKIQNGSLLSSIPFLGFRAIIKQHLTPMYDYLLLENDPKNIDTILKKESLDNDWEKFCKKYMLEYKPLQWINKTKTLTNWKNLYSTYPEASQLVYEIYKKDFEYLGYQIILE